MLWMYSAVADGALCQGGWTCHGGSVTTNDPPELINIGNDPSERYPLLPAGYWPGGDINDDVTAPGLGSVWHEHKAYLEATEPADSPLRSFQYGEGATEP